MTWKNCYLLIILTLVLISSCNKGKKLDSIQLIRIHYVGWNMDFFTAQSCDDLVVHGISIEIKEIEELNQFMSVLSKAQLVPTDEYEGIDARVCCILYENNNTEYSRVSFGPTSLMEMHDKIYQIDSTLFELVLKYLPEDYLSQ